MLNSQLLIRRPFFEQKQQTQQQYDFNKLIKKLEAFIFKDREIKNENNEHMTKHNNHQMNQNYLNSQFYINKKNEAQQFFYTLKNKISQSLFVDLEKIFSQLIMCHSSESQPLKQLYGFLKIQQISYKNITKILTWIYSLCFVQYKQNSNRTLNNIIKKNQKDFLALGLKVLFMINQKKQNQQIIISYQFNQLENSLDNLTSMFKEQMNKYIKKQQQGIHQELFEVCRICQNHIPLNSMQAHLSICQKIYQKEYLILKIQQIGKKMAQNIQFQKTQYDFLDERSDFKIFFQRVFNKFGQKKVIFQIKQDLHEISEIIQQYKSNSNQSIYKIIQLLKKYQSNISAKQQILGYESDDCIESARSRRTRTKNTKFMSKILKKYSSGSLNPDSEGRKSSIGSQTNIRGLDCDNNFLSNKSSIMNYYSLQNFQIIKILGKGAYSQVYLVKNINTNDYFAMKVVQVFNVDNQTLQTLRKQQQIYQKIRSQFAIKLYYTFSQQNIHFFILQYASGGNLRNLLDEQCYLEQEFAKLYLANLILAIQQIHQMNIIHRDLKPQNIVIDQQGFLKLTDFNLAITLNINNQDKQDQNKFFGSPDYIAPEVIKSQLKHHPIRDIWSLGIIAYEILIGVTPFTAMSVQEVFKNILKGQIQWPQEGDEDVTISKQAKSFIEQILQPNPYKRLGFNGIEELKRHQFFKTINWNNIREHKQFFVPKQFDYKKQAANSYLKQKILSKKHFSNNADANNNNNNNNNSNNNKNNNTQILNSIIRFDSLRSYSSLKAKSTRKSRFKLQKQLNQLKKLTSTDKLPIQFTTNTSQKQFQLSLINIQRSSSFTENQNNQFMGIFNFKQQTSLQSLADFNNCYEKDVVICEERQDSSMKSFQDLI